MGPPETLIKSWQCSVCRSVSVGLCPGWKYCTLSKEVYCPKCHEAFEHKIIHALSDEEETHEYGTAVPYRARRAPSKARSRGPKP